MASYQPPTKPQPSVESTTAVNTLSNSNSTPEIQKCLALLDEGKSKVVTNQTDIVFLLGMTGSGKTTLVKFLATNNDNLRSEEVAENIGEYVITDSDQKISSSPILSQTIFPEQYLDPESQIPFNDGPGFSDTRGLAVDIAGAYFVNKVISESNKIRFILTVNYSSVRRGMDRGDFLELLKHVLHVIKNVDRYLDGIGLVVTKVDNQMMKKDGEMVLVPNETVLENIAKFLIEFKSNIPNVAHGSTAENISKLVAALLHKKDSNYTKIAIFRRPDEAGPISHIQALQDSKTVIKKMIRENLKATSVRKEDFGFAISEESKNKLHDVVASINENIANMIRNVCKSKALIYEAETAKSVDIYEAHKVLQSDFEKLRNWLVNKSDDMALQDFMDDLLTVSQSMKAPFSDDEKNHIIHEGENISFLETINEKKFKGSAFAWKMGLESYLNYLKESAHWYKYMTIWHTVLTSYSVQKKQNDFSYLLNHRVVDLYDEQFVKFFTFCQSLTGELDGFQSVRIDSNKMDQFNRILETTLRPDTTVTFNEKTKTLVVRGKFIKLSEHVNSQKNLPKANFVNVFASEKLFIDVGFNKPNDNLQTFYLAAPTWEVIGTVHIKLDGEKGCCKSQDRALDGDRFSQTGHNGMPGAPGKSAANFIGLVNTVINGESMKITANGGEGSAGQDGGNGDKGYDGDSPITKNTWGSCNGNNFNRFSSRQLGGFVRRVYCIYGDRGSDGGNGGNGGVGGLGGLPGKIGFPVKQPLNIRTEASKGADGAPGSGGEGGEGGKAGRSWNHQKMMWWWRDASCSRSQRLADEYGDCANTDYLRDGHRGHRGYDGANWYGVQEATYTVLANSEATIKEYREFLLQESNNDSISRNSKIEFLSKFDNLPKSKNLYNFARIKRMARMDKLPTNRVKRNSPLDNDKPKWIKTDCFQAPQWPITEKIGHAQTTTDMSVTSIPFTDMLILTDLLIRKLNQTRPNYFQSCTIDDVEVRGCAIQILSIFQKTLANIYGVKDGESMDIDGISVIEKLEKEIRNGSPQNISKILLDSIDNEMPQRKEELRRQLITELELESL
ncbi:hypothetical protein V9T40_008656 [Parthenolecanium corni]|uniref:G domain-containing protein n=1 Tax=Parthenolecanium corni TaxID=536013 RepID=A0AAN9TL95_9HEMI